MGRNGQPSIIRERLTCRGCGAEWAHKERTIKAACPFCHRPKDARERQRYAKAYDNAGSRFRQLKELSKDPEKRRTISRNSQLFIRKRAFFKIAGCATFLCARCGCDDMRLLEINHKNGGGGLEMKTRRREKQKDFYYAIIQGHRAVDDLELLCRPCNAVHALELKFGPLPIKVVWQPDKAV